MLNKQNHMKVIYQRVVPVPRAEFTDTLGSTLHTHGVASHAQVVQSALLTGTHPGCLAHFTAICVVPRMYILKAEMKKKIRKYVDEVFSFFHLFLKFPLLVLPCPLHGPPKKILLSQRNSIIHQKKQPTKTIIFRCSN